MIGPVTDWHTRSLPIQTDETIRANVRLMAETIAAHIEDVPTLNVTDEELLDEARAAVLLINTLITRKEARR